MSFAALIAIGTALLLLPIMTPGEDRATVMEAFFTSTSAVTVTGLVTVDTATAWTGWGQAVSLALIQVGGLGMIVTGTLLILVIGRRVGLRSRVFTRYGSGAKALADDLKILLAEPA